jgi:hypothetical protein
VRYPETAPAILAVVTALPDTDAAPSSAIAVRVLIAVVAILLIGWFVVLARDYSIGFHASKRIVADPGMSAADWSRAMDDFERAHLLDPSSDWSLIQAQYELLRNPDAAMRRAENVLGNEPDNLAAWWVVVRAARDRYPTRYREAVAAIHRLNPTPAGQ